MKLTQNKINEIILTILNQEGLKLIRELRGRENVSEFVLANKLRKDIKIIRHMLYKLHNYNLVGSTRKKDKQKGWYIYYWTLIPENIKFLYIKNKKILLEKLREQIQREESDHFFTCPRRCVRLDFNQSLEFEFHCPECGQLLSQDNNLKNIENLKKEIKILEKEIKEGEKDLKRMHKETKRVVKKKAVKKKAAKKKVIKKKAKKRPAKKKVVGRKTVKKKPLKKKIKKKTVKKKPVKKKTVKRKKISKKSKKKTK